jgi:serine/threonine protein kinase
MSQTRDILPPATVIDCYSIIKLIGSGGFSLIYLAEDEDTQDRVVIKEYLPRKIATRGARLRVEVKGDEHSENFNKGRKFFFQEARALATLRHPNIVNVRTFFLAHNTAYLVMDYEPGKNLGNYIKRYKGGLSTGFLLTVFPAVLDAMSLIHAKGHLHLDIKPSNIHAGLYRGVPAPLGHRTTCQRQAAPGEKPVQTALPQTPAGTHRLGDGGRSPPAPPGRGHHAGGLAARKRSTRAEYESLRQ